MMQHSVEPGQIRGAAGLDGGDHRWLDANLAETMRVLSDERGVGIENGDTQRHGGAHGLADAAGIRGADQHIVAALAVLDEEWAFSAERCDRRPGVDAGG